MGDVLYIGGHDGSGNGKVWLFRAGASALEDITESAITASEICCVEMDTVGKVLYAGGDDGKIYKYDGSWSVEYDTSVSKPILSIKKFDGKWWAVQSDRPNVDAYDSGGSVELWRQDAAGSWTSVSHGTGLDQATCIEVWDFGGTTYLMMTGRGGPGHSNGRLWYSSDGSTFTSSSGLNRQEPMGHPLVHDPDTTPPRLVTFGCGRNGYASGYAWYKEAIDAGTWSGYGDTYSQLCWGSHATHTDGIDMWEVDWYSGRVGYWTPGGGGFQTEVDLRTETYFWRAGFAELDGVLYVCAEGNNPYLSHRGAGGTWTDDLNSGTDILLDLVAGPEFGLDRRRYSTHLHACGPGR